MFEPRHNILSNVRADIGKYVVLWLKHSRESNRAVPGPLLAEFSISSHPVDLKVQSVPLVVVEFTRQFFLTDEQDQFLHGAGGQRLGAWSQ